MNQPSLFPEAPPKVTLTEVPLDHIRDDGTPCPADLLQSITLLGILQPVILRRAQQGAPYLVVAGKRRIACARKVALPGVPALVLEDTTGMVPTMARATENMVRSNNIVDEANQLGAMVENGCSEDDLVRLGFNRQTIRARLRLYRAPEVLKASNKIAPGVLYAVTKLPAQGQEHAVALFQSTGKLTMKDVRGISRARRDEQMALLPDALFEPSTDTPFQRLAEDLVNTYQSYHDDAPTLAREVERIISQHCEAQHRKATEMQYYSAMGDIPPLKSTKRRTSR